MPTVRPKGTPKRKTVEFDTLEFTYDYEASQLVIEATDGTKHIVLTKPEISELHSALKSFGLSASASGAQVEFR